MKAPAASFAAAVRTIIIADAVMGIDNVLAIGGASHGSILLILLGLAISVPIIVWGSQLVIKLVDRYPSVILLGRRGAVLDRLRDDRPRADARSHWFEAHPAAKLVLAVLAFSIALAPWYAERLSEQMKPLTVLLPAILIWMLGFEIAAERLEGPGRLPDGDHPGRVPDRRPALDRLAAARRALPVGALSGSLRSARMAAARSRTEGTMLAGPMARRRTAPCPASSCRSSAPCWRRRPPADDASYCAELELYRRHQRQRQRPALPRRHGRRAPWPNAPGQLRRRHPAAGEEAARRALHPAQATTPD